MTDQYLENLSVDCTIFGYTNGKLQILLIKRDKEPGKDQWSLPGSYVNYNETTTDAAKRVLNELTGIHDIYLSQVSVFDHPDRYATRVVSIVYCALIKSDLFELLAGSHAKEVKWHTVEKLRKLPFDHNQMVETSLSWLKEEMWRKPIMVNLLPEKFPLNQMQDLYQFISNISIDNRNFRKKVINQGLVVKLNEKTTGGQQRPAFLYKLMEHH